MDAQAIRLYKLKADVLAAAGHPIRLAIIDFLKDGEQCVCDISSYVAAKRSNVSRHLGILLKAGVVEQRKDGLKMMYSLRTPCVLNFMQCVDGVLRANAREANELLRSL
jgi:DNA-binding transcriptional ArsR family regulator